MGKIRLIVLSKFQIVRSALRSLLSAMSDIEIIGDIENPSQLERAVSMLHPDVVLVETEARESAR